LRANSLEHVAQVPYIPPVIDKSDVNQIDQAFIGEQPDLDLGDVGDCCCARCDVV
jgi:hypothetical protein